LLAFSARVHESELEEGVLNVGGKRFVRSASYYLAPHLLSSMEYSVFWLYPLQVDGEAPGHRQLRCHDPAYHVRSIAVSSIRTSYERMTGS
jgi:hypothetical protein